jgi:energy-coupling factor transporter transmembrane protein EcfT
MSFLHDSIERFDQLWSAASELRNGAPPEGLLQRCGVPARIVATALALAGVISTHSFSVLVAVYFVCALAALLSLVRIGRYLRTNLLLVLVFAAPLALLGSLALVTPGDECLRIGPVAFSVQGVRSSGFVSLRALGAVSLSMLLMRSAGIRGFIAGLRGLGLPEGVTAALQMTVAHIHVLGRSAHSMVHALRSRSIVQPGVRQAYAATAAHGAVLLHKSLQSSRQVHGAMLARGFDGRFPAARPAARWRAADFLLVAAGAAILAAGVAW